MERTDPDYLLECLLAGERDPSLLDDSAFMATVEAARTDPTVMRAFREARLFDETFRTQINQAPVPGDLRARLLGLTPAQEADAGNAPVTDVIPPPQSFWSNFGHWSAFGGAAAAIALFAISLTFFRPPAVADWDPSFREFVSNVESTAGQNEELDPINQWSEVRSHLASLGSPSPERPPRGICPTRTVGCKALEVRGVKAGMICFDTEHGILRLYTFRRADVPLKNCIDAPEFRRIGDHSVAAWSKDDEVFMLLGDMDVQLMASLF
ncbi:MAG: hypothetical protein JJT96_18220 [Opitutales bacterium]|nr:hypothetical protein [Opitutales bacterium]